MGIEQTHPRRPVCYRQSGRVSFPEPDTTSTMTPQQFRLMRHLMCYTQEELAEAMDLTQDHVSQMESGQIPILRVHALAMQYLKILRDQAA